MDQIKSSQSSIWDYLSQNQKDLLQEGDYLLNEISHNSSYAFKDYSFVIFPYAKAYEGYLKTIFKDVGFISHLDYISDHLRMGKLLSPFLMGRLGSRSLYRKIQETGGKELAERIWSTWKTGRNQIFHYFPHNFKAVSFDEAKQIILQIMQTMEAAYQQLMPKSDVPKINQASSAPETATI